MVKPYGLRTVFMYRKWNKMAGERWPLMDACSHMPTFRGTPVERVCAGRHPPAGSQCTGGPAGARRLACVQAAKVASWLWVYMHP